MRIGEGRGWVRDDESVERLGTTWWVLLSGLIFVYSLSLFPCERSCDGQTRESRGEKTRRWHKRERKTRDKPDTHGNIRITQMEKELHKCTMVARLWLVSYHIVVFPRPFAPNGQRRRQVTAVRGNRLDISQGPAWDDFPVRRDQSEPPILQYVSKRHVALL